MVKILGEKEFRKRIFYSDFEKLMMNDKNFISGPTVPPDLQENGETQGGAEIFSAFRAGKTCVKRLSRRSAPSELDRGGLLHTAESGIPARVREGF